MLNNLPRPVIVFGTLFIGVILFFVIQKPHSVCDSQLEVFRESQKGQIFTYKVKNSNRPALYPRVVEACRMGNSSGACYEMFSILKKLMRDLNASPQECLVPFGEVAEVKKALNEGTQIVVQLAWGEKPPENAFSKFGWFQTADIGLFCSLKSTYLRVYGESGWNKFRLATHKKLPGEASVYENGACLNCEYKKMANEKLSDEEIWVKSLFSVRCDQFQ